MSDQTKRDLKIEKTEEQWRKELSPEQYAVARAAGTEAAFTGKYWNEKAAGTYRCVCCGNDLFDSNTKYDSGSGWPSFYAPREEGAITEHQDRSNGMLRTEAVCSNCDAHLGHVFPDGPAPTGLRYCINSASLDFEKKHEDPDT